MSETTQNFINSKIHERWFFFSIKVWTSYLKVIQFLAASLILKLKIFCGVKVLNIYIF